MKNVINSEKKKKKLPMRVGLSLNSVMLETDGLGSSWQPS